MIVTCPVCTNRIDVVNPYVTSVTCDLCRNQVLVEKDDSLNIGEWLGKSWKYLLAGFILLILGVKGCNYIDEKDAYKFAISRPDLEGYISYTARYPDGYFKDEMAIFHDTTSYKLAKESLKTTESTCDCKQFSDYISNFPNGQKIKEANEGLVLCKEKAIISCKNLEEIIRFEKDYPSFERIDTIHKMYDARWNQIMKGFDEIAFANKLGAKEQSFFKRLLSYLRQTKQSTVYIVYDGDTNLKDWDDYSEESKSFLNTLLEMSSDRAGKPTLKESEPISPKNAFNSGSRLGMVSSRVDGTIQDRMKKFLGVHINIVSGKPNGEAPTMNVKYTVKNQEIKIGNTVLPDILEYYNITSFGRRGSEDEGAKTFKDYIFGLSINWEFKIDIPNDDNDYTFNHYSENAPKLTSDDRVSPYDMLFQSTLQDFVDKFGKVFAKEKK